MPSSRPYALALVIDDDPDILVAAQMLLHDLFDDVVTAASPDAAMASVARSPDVILLDGNFARGATNAAEGFRCLDAILATDPDAAVVLITAHSGVQVAVEAMKRGATDFVSKPWSHDRLLTTVRTAANLRQSRRQLGQGEGARSQGAAAAPTAAALSLLGDSPAMRRVHSLIARAGPTQANVMILGENGTGKELVARAIHAASRRAAAPLVTVDLGAVAETLFDSELFGHVKGAFTDARGDSIGRLRAADGGTLFLDEVGNLPLHLQPKLLTALEQRRVTPVGSSRSEAIDVRVIAATNLDHARLADDRVFRQDLLFRLNTVEIELPPLRERREDIPALLAHYLRHYEQRYAAPERALPPEVLAALVAHDWPGNVRALRHAAERAVILAPGDAYQIDDFPLGRGAAVAPVVAAPPPAPAPAGLNLDRLERETVEAALRKHSYNISQAATELGLSRFALYRRMEKHGL
ncbi:DNA-binding NtrC family response regulator [Sphingomonas jinjuensis]|uniref:DNA-binding NtrC family response regulator n=1 Tax=Sphingomonas jinjuensis TaxID=535907 RepID=A0A840FDS8_9SPHN|nr:sigma-54 dependent transcriptional regulator [Sphingomonas jinjuensis]MBB4155759.1 DNA-binding NtrC family response regulator [Sphingomonas jinjuensis]